MSSMRGHGELMREIVRWKNDLRQTKANLLAWMDQLGVELSSEVTQQETIRISFFNNQRV